MDFYPISIMYLIALSLVCFLASFLIFINYLLKNYCRRLKWENEVKEKVIKDIMNKSKEWENE